jgi:2-dehydro-3-deoxygluconokinase
MMGVRSHGLAYDLMELGSIQEAVDYDAVHVAPVMTTPDDTTMVTSPEVRVLATGGNARIER